MLAGLMVRRPASRVTAPYGLMRRTVVRVSRMRCAYPGYGFDAAQTLRPTLAARMFTRWQCAAGMVMKD
ncbi:MAG: hypothetical protein A2045_03525 [Rhodocyclales bacterium GWA2_65_20]|nr:MAG: hypothetical protein A2045_03525 [Rhodocyclales bacterium GWA2_65_20]